MPRDRFFWVRASAITAYAVAYVVHLRRDGRRGDRVSVAVWVGLFLLCAFIGKPWRQWAVLVVDATLYASMWFAYETTRGAADHLGFPLQADLARDLDRVLFLGADPTVWLQDRLFHPDDVRWYDNVASAIYYTHFVVPVVALAVLWAASRVQWVRFMKRLAAVLAVACVSFIVVPTVPPWIAADPRFGFASIPPEVTRNTWRGFIDMGFTGFVHDWQISLDWSNPVAAMPSLHVALALFVPAFFLPMVRPAWAKAAMMLFPLAMLTSLVYLGEHWVIDGIGGAALVGASFWFWNRVERRQRHTRAARARLHLAREVGAEADLVQG
ncbi:MAG: phosphatase PAP2 family protein [Actinomycetota bacterium]